MCVHSSMSVLYINIYIPQFQSDMANLLGVKMDAAAMKSSQDSSSASNVQSDTSMKSSTERVT